MALLDLFIGTPQSKYAATAIMAAILVVALAILFGKEKLPIGQKFLFILIMFIVALPSVLLGLFQLTCIVTGSGYKNKRWWLSLIHI
jgi:ABC-type spermidine/putrescine transport system permease subunit II